MNAVHFKTNGYISKKKEVSPKELIAIQGDSSVFAQEIAKKFWNVKGRVCRENDKKVRLLF